MSGRNWTRRSIEELVEQYLRKKPKKGESVKVPQATINEFLPFTSLDNCPGDLQYSDNLDYVCMCSTVLKETYAYSDDGYHPYSGNTCRTDGYTTGISGMGSLVNENGEVVFFTILTKPRGFDYGTDPDNHPYYHLDGNDRDQHYQAFRPHWAGQLSMAENYGQWFSNNPYSGYSAVLECDVPRTFNDSSDPEYLNYYAKDVNANVYCLGDIPQDGDIGWSGLLKMFVTGGADIKIESFINGTGTQLTYAHAHESRSVGVPMQNHGTYYLSASKDNASIASKFTTIKANTAGTAVMKSSISQSAPEVTLPLRLLSMIRVSQPLTINGLDMIPSPRTVTAEEYQFYIYSIIRILLEGSGYRNAYYNSPRKCQFEIDNYDNIPWDQSTTRFHDPSNTNLHVTYNKHII